MATADKPTTVAENVPKVYHAGQLNVVENAECLKGSKTGTAILIDDVSPVTHEMGVRVRGKNLSVDVSNRTDVFFRGSPTTTYNITGSQLIKGFAVNGNATTYHITDFVNSNGTVSFKTSNVNYTIGIDVIVVQGETYTVSANITGGTSESKPIWIVFLKDGLFQSYTTAQSFTVPNNCNQAILLIRPSAANTECSFSNVQLELGTKATDYEPYNSDIQNVHSKNLIPYPYSNTTKTENGITFTDNGDGTITVNGTTPSDSGASFQLTSNDISIKAGTYSTSGCVSGSNSSGDKIMIMIVAQDDDYNMYDLSDTGSNKTTTIVNDSHIINLSIQIPPDITLNNAVFRPQLEYGSTATAYTKYHEPYPLVVSRCGKNLFNISKISSIDNLTNNGDGTLTIAANKTYQTTLVKLGTICPNLKVGDNIVFSFISPSSRNDIYLQKSKRSFVANIKYIVTQDDLDSAVTWYGYQIKDTNYGNPCTISNIQIERGISATEYEPYITPTEYIPNSDGTVEGVESLYPSTTLLTNDPYGKVYIDCEYYKDIDKTFNELTTSVALSGGE